MGDPRGDFARVVEELETLVDEGADDAAVEAKLREASAALQRFVADDQAALQVPEPRQGD